MVGKGFQGDGIFITAEMSDARSGRGATRGRFFSVKIGRYVQPGAAVPSL